MLGEILLLSSLCVILLSLFISNVEIRILLGGLIFFCSVHNMS